MQPIIESTTGTHEATFPHGISGRLGGPFTKTVRPADFKQMMAVTNWATENKVPFESLGSAALAPKLEG